LNQPNTGLKPREVAPHAFETPNVAYIKAVVVDGQPMYAIHGGDGSPLAVAPTRELALAAVRQNGMDPVDAH
jgi:hypothetical protein